MSAVTKPFNNILITNSSFSRDGTDESAASVYLFPEFRWVPSISLNQTVIEGFVQGYLLPKKAHREHQRLLKDTRLVYLQQPRSRDRFSNHEIRNPFVLICGHGGRDRRCGIMGPLLEAEFLKIFQKKESPPSSGSKASNPINKTQVGLTSHIGGHKFAGNIIIYIPPSSLLPDGTSHPLGGKGIWYGRVEPKHVEGIVNETILGGRVIGELFRGGVGREGEVLR